MSTPILVNNIQFWSRSPCTEFTETKASHLFHSSVSVFLICQFRAAPRFRALSITKRNNRDWLIDLSLWFKEYSDHCVRATVSDKIKHFKSLLTNYLFFLPFIWHYGDPFSQCKQKSWRGKQNLSSYKLMGMSRVIWYNTVLRETSIAASWLAGNCWGILIVTWSTQQLRRGNIEWLSLTRTIIVWKTNLEKPYISKMQRWMFWESKFFW